VQLPAQRAPGQKVCPGRFQLARAGAKESEAKTQFLDGAVDLVEQRRQPLHFIHNHPDPGRLAAQFVAEELGVAQVSLVKPLVQQIQPQRTGKMGASPRTLADTAKPEQKEAVVWRPQEPRIPRVVWHAVIYPGKMTP
jgi:hypothetical protein